MTEVPAEFYARSQVSDTDQDALPVPTKVPSLARMYRQVGLGVDALRAARGSAPESNLVLRRRPVGTPGTDNVTVDNIVVPPGVRGHVDTWCGGTGTDGDRVQLVYMREVDDPDRYAATKPLIVDEAHFIDDVFAVASWPGGGGLRVRWVQSSACELNVLNVVVPDGKLNDFNGMEDWLMANGYLKTHRKYLAWVDHLKADGTPVICGGGRWFSDSDATDNLNDGRYPQLARMDLGCWTRDGVTMIDAPTHELVHTLGGVQSDSPHGTPGAHCHDAAETMCYDDGYGGTYEACPFGNGWDLDCNDDDYFNVNPTPGSYLATHWNIANSTFLQHVPTLPTPPTATLTATTTTPTPEQLVTVTADAAPDTTLRWSISRPDCRHVTTANDTPTTYSVRCYENGGPLTVTATATNANVITESYNPILITWEPQPDFSQTTVTGTPSTVLPTQPFTITATVAPTNLDWSFTWTPREDTRGCTFDRPLNTPIAGTNQMELHGSCDYSRMGTLASFTVTAEREDGEVRFDSGGVRIETPPPPSLSLRGPTTLPQGGKAVLSALAGEGNSPDNTVTWTSSHGWIPVGWSGSQVLVQIPKNASVGDTDLIVATVRDPHTGFTGEARYGVQVTPALTSTVRGSKRLIGGSTETYATVLNQDAAVSWSLVDAATGNPPLLPGADPDADAPACDLTQTTGPNDVTIDGQAAVTYEVEVACDPAYVGVLTLASSAAVAGLPEVDATRTVYVTQDVPTYTQTVLSLRSVTAAARAGARAGDGAGAGFVRMSPGQATSGSVVSNAGPATVRVTDPNGAALANVPVTLYGRTGSGADVTALASGVTGPDGTAVFPLAPTQPTTVWAAVSDSLIYEGSQSGSLPVAAASTLTVSKQPGPQLVGTLTSPTGKGLGSQVVTLMRQISKNQYLPEQKRKTTSKGLVTFNPKVGSTAVRYYLAYAGSDKYLPVRSRLVKVKR